MLLLKDFPVYAAILTMLLWITHTHTGTHTGTHTRDYKQGFDIHSRQ